MYIYTHRRWAKKSVIYGGGREKLHKSLTPPQQKNFLSDGYVKLFMKLHIDVWYFVSNVVYGPHVWILKDPHELPPVSDELINFAIYYYKETEAEKRYRYSDYQIKEKVDPRDINWTGSVWDNKGFVDAAINEFGVIGFRLKDGAAIFNPFDTPMEYYYDYDEKEFKYNQKKYLTSDGNNPEFFITYSNIVSTREYKDKKIEDNKELINIFRRLNPTEYAKYLEDKKFYQF